VLLNPEYADMILHMIANMVHESMLNTGNAISSFLGLSHTANRAQSGTSPSGQANSNGSFEEEVSRLAGKSMKESPNVQEHQEG
jgi:hypothetical protein